MCTTNSWPGGQALTVIERHRYFISSFVAEAGSAANGGGATDISVIAYLIRGEGALTEEWISNRPADKIQDRHRKGLIKLLFMLFIFLEVIIFCIMFSLFLISLLNAWIIAFFTIFPPIVFVIFYFIIFDSKKVMISEVSFGESKLILKNNSGKSLTIHYKNIQSVKPFKDAGPGFNIQDLSNQTYVIRHTRSSFNEITGYHINSVIAERLEAKLAER